MSKQKFLDMAGKRFGRLTVLSHQGSDKNWNAIWLCLCDCGEEIVMLGSNLRSGNTRSCGCLHREVMTKHGGKGTRIFRIWHGMKQRCENPRNAAYRYYGGKGVVISKEWIGDFPAFRDWAFSNGYADDLTIDRLDSNKGYCPENCEWVTQSENNRRMNEQRGRIKRKEKVNYVYAL